MKYTTVYEIYKPDEIPVIENLFEENNIDFRVLKGAKNDAMREGVKFQVSENQRKKAIAILLENGIVHKPAIIQKGKRKSRFWIFLLLTVLVIIIVGFLVNWFMN